MSESAKEPIELHGSGRKKVRGDFVCEGSKLHGIVKIGSEELPQFSGIQGEAEIEKSDRTDVRGLLANEGEAEEPPCSEAYRSLPRR